jgi:hypothetical protein
VSARHFAAVGLAGVPLVLAGTWAALMATSWFFRAAAKYRRISNCESPGVVTFDEQGRQFVTEAGLAGRGDTGQFAVPINGLRRPDLWSTVGTPEVFMLRQYSGIQTPKYQKPHPPKTGLKTGMAV